MTRLVPIYSALLGFLLINSISLIAQEDTSCETCIIRISSSDRYCAPDIPNNLAEDSDIPLLDYYGEVEYIESQGIRFRVFNSDETARTIIREMLDLLPSDIIRKMPRNYLIGHPSRGLNYRRHRTSDGGSRVMGGSKICDNDGLPYNHYEYEAIIFHRNVFRQRTKYQTVLHELGHFVDHRYNIASDMNDDQRSKSTEYLNEVYNGSVSNHGETIAQGFMYLMFNRYFENLTTLKPTPVPISEIRSTRKLPEWLRDHLIYKVGLYF